MQTKVTLLREKYATISGAKKRAAFENGVAESEYRHGWKAHLYAYRVVIDDTFFRVERFRPDRYPPTDGKLAAD